MFNARAAAASKPQLYIGNSGTTVRFTALVALAMVSFASMAILPGSAAAVQDLSTRAFRQFGVDARSESATVARRWSCIGAACPAARRRSRGVIQPVSGGSGLLLAGLTPSSRSS